MLQTFFDFVKTGIFYKFFKLVFFITRPSEVETGTSDVISGSWWWFWSGIRDRNTSSIVREKLSWPTDFSLKYLEHTAENMMHSQFCTCVFTLRAKSKQLKTRLKYNARLGMRRRSTDFLKWRQEMYWTQTLLTSSATRLRFKLLRIFALLKIHKKLCLQPNRKIFTVSC